MLRARIFCLQEGRGSDVRCGRRTGRERSQAICARAAGRATREGRHVRDAWGRGERLFSFSQEKIDEVFACSSGGGSGAQLQYRVGIAAETARNWGTGPACRESIPWRPVAAVPAYRPQIPMRERRARGTEMFLFLLTLYIQYIIKFGGCQKWKVEENGRDGKIWEARNCWKRGLREGCVGGNGREVRWLPPKIKKGVSRALRFSFSSQEEDFFSVNFPITSYPRFKNIFHTINFPIAFFTVPSAVSP